MTIFVTNNFHKKTFGEGLSFPRDEIDQTGFVTNLQFLFAFVNRHGYTPVDRYIPMEDDNPPALLRFDSMLVALEDRLHQ